jgi:hypothetical protein
MMSDPTQSNRSSRRPGNLLIAARLGSGWDWLVACACAPVLLGVVLLGGRVRLVGLDPAYEAVVGLLP